jgi:hypothetical protein
VDQGLEGDSNPTHAQIECFYFESNRVWATHPAFIKRMLISNPMDIIEGHIPAIAASTRLVSFTVMIALIFLSTSGATMRPSEAPRLFLIEFAQVPVQFCLYP